MLTREVLTPRMPRALFATSLAFIGLLGAIGMAAAMAMIVRVPARTALVAPAAQPTRMADDGFNASYSLSHISNIDPSSTFIYLNAAIDGAGPL